MQIKKFTCYEEVRQKILLKHSVLTEELDEVFRSKPKYLFVKRGVVRKNEDLYSAIGRTEAGRLIIIFFIIKSRGEALILSARDATRKERKKYERK